MALSRTLQIESALRGHSRARLSAQVSMVHPTAKSHHHLRRIGDRIAKLTLQSSTRMDRAIAVHYAPPVRG